MRADAQEKFNLKLDPLFITAEFAKVRRVVVLPHMLIPLTVEQLKTFFEKQIKELGGGFVVSG